MLAGGSAYAYPRLKGEVFKTEIGITEIALISPAQASITVTSTGYVVPQIDSARPGVRFLGASPGVLVKEGDVVKAGQVLAELEDADQKSAIASAEARVASARARARPRAPASPR